MKAVVVALLLAVSATLAGCSDDGIASQRTTGTPDGGPSSGLHGWVFDVALRPLPGATVKVLDTNSSTTTEDDGGYGFDGLPTEQFLVIVATAPGFKPSSKQITLSPETAVRLNFTLEAEPVKVPRQEILSFNGILGCQAAVTVSGSNQTHNCGAGAVQELDTWDFSIGPDLAGAVVEVVWDAQAPVSESLGARLETLELGKLNLVLGDLVGTSPLRVYVPPSVATKYYPEGGLMRLTVFARPNGEENEAGIAASAVFQQSFAAYSTLCYVQPPAPSYSFAGGSQKCSDG